MARAVDMGEGTIYPLMRRMQSEGLVTTYLEESPSGPSRKYYRITETGRDRLSAPIGERRAFPPAVARLIDGEPSPARYHLHKSAEGRPQQTGSTSDRAPEE